jgi:hypothetical protein
MDVPENRLALVELRSPAEAWADGASGLLGARREASFNKPLQASRTLSGPAAGKSVQLHSR